MEFSSNDQSNHPHEKAGHYRSMSAVESESGVIALAVRRPIALVMVYSAIAVFGLISLTRLPIDLMPEVNRPTITVRTEYPGAAPEDVEDRIARRLEKSLSVVKGLLRLTSISRAETCDVILEFSWDANLRDAVQDVREKLDHVFLPDDAESPMVLRYDPRLEPILLIGLEGSFDLRDLRRLAEEEVERRLETVEGIAAVRVRGGLEEEIGILVDEERLRSRGVSIERIGQRLAEENLDRAAGLLSDGDLSYIVRTRNEFRTLNEVGEIPIRFEGESILRLRDVATIVPQAREERVITRIDGRPAVQIEVLREGDANIVALAGAVRKRLFGTEGERAQLARWLSREEGSDQPRKVGQQGKRVFRPDYVESWLPPEARLVILSDQSVFIEEAIDDLKLTAIIGGILAILVLFLFLGRLSYTLIVAVTIPCSVIATFAPMYLGGISLNIMSLGGLALGIGMLVDSSIVVLESIFRRREEGLGALESAIAGGKDVAGAVVAATLTTVAVFFPIVFVEGMAGQFFRDQALTVVMSLLAALVVSLTLIPMLAARLSLLNTNFGKEKTTFGSTRFWTAVRYRAILRWSRRSRSRRTSFFLSSPVLFVYLALSVVIDLLSALFQLLVVLLFTFIRGVLRFGRSGGQRAVFPFVSAFRAGYDWLEGIYVRVIRFALTQRALVLLCVGGSLLGAMAAIQELGSELVPEVSRGEFSVNIRYPVGTPIETTDRFARALERELTEIPEIVVLATTVGRDREEVRESQAGDHTIRFGVRVEGRDTQMEQLEARVLNKIGQIVGQVDDHDWEVRRPNLFSHQSPIEIEIRGPHLEDLEELERQVRKTLASIPQLREVRSTISPGSPEYHLFPDRDALARYGTTSERIASVLRRKNLGEVVSRFRSDDRRIDMRVQVRESDRQSIDDLLALVVEPRANGDGIRIGDLIERWEPREGPGEIRRISRQRAVVVSAEIEGIDLGRIAQTIEQRLLNELTIPPEVVVEVVGQKKEMERSLESLLAALGLAVFLVYVVMASQFESLKQPFVILFTIPLAAVGVILTLWITGTPLSVIAFIGMIVLAGIVVNNAIVLLDQVNRLRGDGLDTHEALVAGGRRRLRPILMTTSTTVLALLPVTGILSLIPHPAALDALLGTGAGAEIRAPLALTVIGGLLSSTLLTLIVVPVVYSIFERGFSARNQETSLPASTGGQ